MKQNQDNEYQELKVITFYKNKEKNKLFEKINS